MMPFFVNTARTVSDGRAPFFSHASAFSASISVVGRGARRVIRADLLDDGAARTVRESITTTR